MSILKRDCDRRNDEINISLSPQGTAILSYAHARNCRGEMAVSVSPARLYVRILEICAGES